MMKILAALLISIPSLAAAQAPPAPLFPTPGFPDGHPAPGTGRTHTPLRRADGQPTDEVLMKISRQCHRANSSPDAAKSNCFYIDKSISARAAEPGASPEIKSRAEEIAR